MDFDPLKFARIRRTLKLSREQFAAQCREVDSKGANPITARTVFNWEHGKSAPSLGRLLVAIKTFKCELTDVCKGTREEGIR
ncbi:MAG: hypothetical protein ABIH46_08095 [Chloroflexota bacterium]